MTDETCEYPFEIGDRVCHHNDYSLTGIVTYIDRNFPHPTACNVLWDDCIRTDPQFTDKLFKADCTSTSRLVISETLFKVTLPDGYEKVLDNIRVGDKFLMQCDDNLVGFSTVSAFHLHAYGTDPNLYNYPIRRIESKSH